MTDQPANVNDVAKPGTTQPPATSRPVIVGHGVTVADPMVSEKTPAATSSLSTSTGSTKQPLPAPSTPQDVKKEVSDDEDQKLAEQSIEKKPEPVDKQARLGELIESGEYNVDIKQVRAGKAGVFFATVAVIVFVGAAVFFVLADLEIIDLGFKLPFELFK